MTRVDQTQPPMLAIFLFVVLNPLLGYLARYLLSGDGVVYYPSPALYTAFHMLASAILGFVASAFRSRSRRS